MSKKLKDLQAEWNKSDSRKYIRTKLPMPKANVKSESSWESYRERALLEAALDKPTYSPEEIAKRHGVSVKKIESQLKEGIKVEQEHTSDLKVAREIALDHLGERPDYYTKLEKAHLEEGKRNTTSYNATATERRRVVIDKAMLRKKQDRANWKIGTPVKRTMKEELTPREQQSHEERLKPAQQPTPEEQAKKQTAEHDKNTLGMMRNLVFHKKLPIGQSLKEEAPHPGHVMNFSDRMEHSYHGYSQAKKDRDAYAAHLKSQGIRVKKSSVTNQLLHGSYGNVYKVSHTGHMEESYNITFDESGPHNDKYSPETMKLIQKIKLQKKALLGRISILNRKTVQEAFKAAKDKKNGKAPEKDGKKPLDKNDVKPQKELQDNLPDEASKEPNKDVSAAPPQFGADKVAAGAPGAEKKVSNTPTPEKKSAKIQVKGPGPDDKFQADPIVTPLTTMPDTVSPKSGSQGVR